MVKQVRNSEGRVFKQAYGSREHARFADYDRSTRKDHIEAHKYYEIKARKEINEIRKHKGLLTIPLRSTDWYHEDRVLEGLEDEKYAQVI